ncbi:ribosome small subunit-dependent GTPase A [Amphibacillus sediminis]|uniref:ribosome small subunit-dependent GTPase A n=1 Tax=Amphibacillus sediminis TaxID=360185 RepID=UPI00082C820C|nr:ribosome small subunit-dependent GTPase A [Amphibacillus sediminis]
MATGQIMKALSGFYYVLSDGETYQCRGRGLFRKKKQTPLVGDHVIFDADNQSEGYLIELLPRKNELVRPPIANLDQVIITVSAKEPDFSTALLDRFLTLVEANQIQPVILVTKVDLVNEAEIGVLNDYINYYRKIGYQVEVLSNKQKMTDSSSFTALFENKISVIAGQSGVGKSSFLNLLDPNLALKTAEISTSLGRGRHTTRHVELIDICGGLVADTPGFSSLEFDTLELEHLPSCFVEFSNYRSSCKFRGCMHINEPKCAVKEAVDRGDIASHRYQNYLQFYQEINLRKPRY